jgi:ABC-2 type transport system ATP-binding protein
MSDLPVPPPAIRVRGLRKRYSKSKVNAVDGVSFDVARGEIFGLLGPNGAGKTTSIGILTTSIVPTEGAASIIAIDVAADPISVKQRIAVVPQQSNLDRSLKVREILTFHAAYHGVPKKIREALADKLLNDLGLGERKNEKVTRYSGGMAQRLMIARAHARTGCPVPGRAYQQSGPAIETLSLGAYLRDERARLDHFADRF